MCVGGRVRTFERCLVCRGGSSGDAIRSCMHSLARFSGCYAALGVTSTREIGAGAMGDCVRCLRERNGSSTAGTEVATSLHTFFHCLVGVNIVRGGPMATTRGGGITGGVPNILRSNSVIHLLSRPSNSSCGDVHSGTVLRLLCTANVGISRLLSLGIGSFGLRLKVLRLGNTGGREVVPVCPTTVGSIDSCLLGIHPTVILRSDRSGLFAGVGNLPVSHRNF